ncbi:hypothetical protein DF185_06935 [Marinifilum breve]|uniref:BRCT domain-containing protein n=1 Tax=Marinifilum breve TaxID=2184082 RepID=A0A2V4A198_9BACT|nr:exonuclease domain-containing protein [Marinifilum breve]PXY02376.1 hypothetical protein DF185_06935 [Marinifilum breve]
MKKIDFVAIDFEHAVPFKGSICSVGIVSFHNGNIVDEFSTLVQPPNNEYSPFTIKVHGITPDCTKNAPSFIEVYPEIRKRIKDCTVVAHNAFSTDKACLEQAMEFNEINENLGINWQCTYAITKAKLNTVAKVCDIQLNHHEALSDAKACGIIYELFKSKKLPIEAINKECCQQKKKSTHNYYQKERLKGDIFKPDFENATNKSNPFFMKKVVITGFSTPQKKEIATELKLLGADIDSGVTKRTNFLITGENVGPSKLAKMKKNIDEGKEAKILKFEEYETLKEEKIQYD